MDKPITASSFDSGMSAGYPGQQELSLGMLHTFVEIGELRRLLGQLTTVEMLRLLMCDAAGSSSPEP